MLDSHAKLGLGMSTLNGIDLDQKDSVILLPSPSYQVNLLQPDPSRLLENLPPQDVTYVYHNTDIAGDELIHLECRHEGSKATENN